MRMPVMEIRPVRMRVRHAFVGVTVRMTCRRRKLQMLVQMMPVVVTMKVDMRD